MLADFSPKAKLFLLCRGKERVVVPIEFRYVLVILVFGHPKRSRWVEVKENLPFRTDGEQVEGVLVNVVRLIDETICCTTKLVSLR